MWIDLPEECLKEVLVPKALYLLKGLTCQMT